MSVSSVGLDHPFELSRTNAAAQKKLMTAVEKHNREWDALEAEAASLRASPTESWSPESDERAAELRKRRVSLLNAEIVLHGQIDDFLVGVNDDLSAAISAASERHAAARQDVR